MPYQRPKTAIGKRRDRARIEYLTTVDDGMGGQTPSRDWIALGSIWVLPVPLDERTQEHVDGARLTAKHAYHFDARYRTDITPRMRMVWRAKTLEIQTVVDDDARKQRMLIYATEIQ